MARNIFKVLSYVNDIYGSIRIVKVQISAVQRYKDIRHNKAIVI